MAGCTTTSDCFLASADFLGLNVYIASALPEFYCTVTRCFECVGSTYASPLCPEYMVETAADVLAFEV